MSSSVPLEKRLVWSRVLFVVTAHLLALAALVHPTVEGLFYFALFYVLTGGLGISVGYHRLLSHRSFVAERATRLFLALLGTLSVQAGPLSWVALHRAHHRFPDKEGDPHASSLGFWWSHILWAFVRAPNGFRFRRLPEQVPDLSQDLALVWMERHFVTCNVLIASVGFAFLSAEAWLWAFPLRIVAVWHVTWAVNSLAHGAHTKSPKPLNLRILAWLSFGEGFHANHHARPLSPDFSSAETGVDFGFGLIRILQILGFARPRRPS